MLPHVFVAAEILELEVEEMPFFMGADAMFAFLILFKIFMVNKIPQNMRQKSSAYTALLPSNIL